MRVMQQNAFIDALLCSSLRNDGRVGSFGSTGMTGLDARVWWFAKDRRSCSLVVAFLD